MDRRIAADASLINGLVLILFAFPHPFHQQDSGNINKDLSEVVNHRQHVQSQESILEASESERNTSSVTRGYYCKSYSNYK